MMFIMSMLQDELKELYFRACIANLNACFFIVRIISVNLKVPVVLIFGNKFYAHILYTDKNKFCVEVKRR